jgi:hypothetical protein
MRGFYLAQAFLKEQQMEAAVDQPVAGSETAVQGNRETQTPGWLAGLPSDLRDNEAFKPFRTVGDFAKSHLEIAKKAKEAEEKLVNSIPKLGENATPEERDRYLNSLGRPEKPDGYELDGEDKNSPEWTGYWRNELHRIGVPKDQAKAISTAFNNQIKQMVDAHNAKILSENEKAATALKAELGDKYDASVVLVSRLWKQWGKTEVEFDKAFATESSANRTTMMRFLLNVAAKTGEDLSLRGSVQRAETPKAGYDLSKFNLPKARI